MTSPGILGHVIDLLRSSHVPQALFFRKNDVPVIFRTCTSPVEDISPAAGALFPANSDSQMALAILVMGQEH